MSNSCIVLEGDGLRVGFTGGVLEYFLKKEINFDRVIGVSARACMGASYISKSDIANIGVSKSFVATSSIPFLSQPVDI